MDIIRHYDVIVLEQLQGKNMLKNHALAKNISDTGWRIFVSMLQYKANMYGRTVILVNPAYTTQTCPMLAVTSADGPISQLMTN